jgi:methionyl-tRNA synthetase
MKGLYLTTTLPYVNADPHIGFALELVQADILARYGRLFGKKVFFNTGTDEHGVKIWNRAREQGKEIKEYVDEYAAKFRALAESLHLATGDSNFNFIRTTDEHHLKAAQEFWRRCREAGDIYKKNYQIKYCTGCELEKTDSELVDGHCPLHPNLIIEIIEEENYYFRFSKYQQALLNLYDNSSFVVPAGRLKEIRTFVEAGLQDFSISRLANKMPWGIPVPDDPDQVMYVWFDALVNYISAIGWPYNEEKFKEWWPAVQLAGKDNLRQQSAMWQAMLLSAGIEPSKQIVIHGFITSGGQKMSKSLGNVVDPFKVIEDYGSEALRYYLSREVTPFEDGDFTWEKFKDSYNGNLANGLGNLTSRIIKMYQGYEVPEPDDLKPAEKYIGDDFFKEFRENMDRYELSKAADFIWTQIKEADLYIQNTKPFSVYKTDPEEARKHVAYLVSALWRISIALEPIMPETAKAIRAAIKNKELSAPLFMRKD